MSGGLPASFDVCNGQGVGTAPTSNPSGTSVTAGSANAKGTWTQLIASTAADCVFLIVQATAINDSTSNTVVDIGVGAAASENVLIPNLPLAYSGTNGLLTWSVALPLHIPAGTRISARTQSNAGSNASRISVLTFDGALSEQEGFGGVDNYGFNTGTSRGTSVTSGNNSYGTYVQFTASTTRDYTGLFIGFTNLGSALTATTGNVAVAIGGSGSEQVIIPDYPITFGFGSAETIEPGITHFMPVYVPAGSRLAVRAASGGVSQAFGVMLYGVYQ